MGRDSREKRRRRNAEAGGTDGAVGAGAHSANTAVPPGSRPARVLRALLSTGCPGLGQLIAGRALEAALFFVGVLVPYAFFVALLNVTFGTPGELASLSFLSPRVPIRPPAEHWALLLVGVTVHAASVWHALRRT